jgi:hypothetical protein
MIKNNLNKSIIVGIVFLFLSFVILPVIAQEKPVYEAKPVNDGLPDWTIDDIYIGMSGHDPGPDYQTLFCQFRNSGDAPVPEIYYRVVVKHMRFGIIPISTITTQSYNGYFVPPLPPGKTFTGGLPTDNHGYPLFGFVRFEVTVNPDHTMAESNYGNNRYNETFFEINPIFFPITWYSIL